MNEGKPKRNKKDADVCKNAYVTLKQEAEDRWR